MGGILNQCIHNGFGLHTFKEELTGPEYAYRFIQMIEKEKIPYLLNTIVIEITKNREITYINSEEGLVTIKAKAIVLAMGCRERAKMCIRDRYCLTWEFIFREAELLICLHPWQKETEAA